LKWEEVINIDTGTAIAFIAEGSPVRNELRIVVQNQQIVMAQTAFGEFTVIVQRIGGLLEQARARRFLMRLQCIADNPSPRALNLKQTRSLGANDIIILGTGDNLDIMTITADAKAIRAASAQGVDFKVYVHPPYSLTGE
jgi:Protein of unknown function (DUF1308)